MAFCAPQAYNKNVCYFCTTIDGLSISISKWWNGNLETCHQHIPLGTGSQKYFQHVHVFPIPISPPPTHPPHQKLFPRACCTHNHTRTGSGREVRGWVFTLCENSIIGWFTKTFICCSTQQKITQDRMSARAQFSLEVETVMSQSYSCHNIRWCKKKIVKYSSGIDLTQNAAIPETCAQSAVGLSASATDFICCLLESLSAGNSKRPLPFYPLSAQEGPLAPQTQRKNQAKGLIPLKFHLHLDFSLHWTPILSGAKWHWGQQATLLCILKL